MKILDPSSLGLEIKNRIGEHEYRCSCPYHDDKNPSAQYNTKKNLFYCFSCGQSRTGEEVSDDLGGELFYVSENEVFEINPFDDGKEGDWKAIIYRNKIAKGNLYLKSRKVSDKLIMKYAIKENTEGVIFPLLDRFEEVQGALIRHYDRKPKYYFYGEKPIIWPYDSLYQEGSIALVEGLFGALRLESADVNSAAIMGTNSILKVVQLMRANKHLKPFAWLDPDYAGFLAMGKFALHGIPVLLHHKNVDEMSPNQIRKVLENKKKTTDVMKVIRAFKGDYFRLKDALESYFYKSGLAYD